jgi:ADP-heptose:LPS heptosyltransferase
MSFRSAHTCTGASFKQVLVFRALKLGDMLCAVPALRALRAGLPSARISLAGLPWARSFASRFQRYIDDFIEFPGFPGLPEQQFDQERFDLFLAMIRQARYDLAIQMHGSGRISNEVVALFGARASAGFFPRGHGLPHEEQGYGPYPDGLPEIERNLLLIRNLGFPSRGHYLEFPVTEADARELARHRGLRNLPAGSYVCIHPGASMREKCWPVEHFAAVGRYLQQQGHVVVVTGNGRESDLAKRIEGLMGGRCLDAASPDLSLGGLASLIRGARLLLCNDTGVSHLASALGVPSVVIFSAADPARWAPLDTGLHRALGGKGQLPSVRDVMRSIAALLSRKEYQQ